MRMRYLLPALLLLPPGIALLVPGPAAAFSNINALVRFHIVPATTKNPCSNTAMASPLHTHEYQLSTPTGPFYYTYLVVCNADSAAGLAGLECGIDYPGGYAPDGGLSPISIFRWSLCSDLEFPSAGWPAPGTGNLMTWTSLRCKSHIRDTGWAFTGSFIAVAGYFYMGAYAPAELQIIPRPVSGRLKVADCAAREDDLTDDFIHWAYGVAGFGPGTYDKPCTMTPDPIQPTTWSGIKSKY
jgi:hypothetical protein